VGTAGGGRRSRYPTQGGLAVEVYIVYRIDPISHVRETVGAVVERRKGDRRNDIKGLVQLAQKLYSAPAPDSHIVISLAS